MSVLTFLRNRPSARANPAAPETPDVLRAIAASRRELVSEGRLLSDEIDPERRDRARRLRAMRLSVSVPLAEHWERLGAQGLIPARWLDGARRFIDDPFRTANFTIEQRCAWAPQGTLATEAPTTLCALKALAMAGEEADTIEALWLEAHARLKVFGVPDGIEQPVWGWRDWRRARARTRPRAGGVDYPNLVVDWSLLNQALLWAWNGGAEPDRDAGWDNEATIRALLAPAARALSGLELPLPFNAERLARTWLPFYDTVHLCACAWELAAAADLRVPSFDPPPNRTGYFDRLRPLAGEPFAQWQNPYLPLVEILRRGYGWARVTTLYPGPASPARRPLQHLALVAPFLTGMSREALAVGWC